MNGYPIKSAKQPAGYTLVEVMVTVAMVAIVAVLAVPSYNAVMLKNRRMAAESFLMDIAQRQQQYLLDSRAYAADLTSAELNLSVPGDVSSYYTIGCCNTTATPPTFRATATPTASQSADSCQVLVIDSSGKKDTSPSGIAGCW